MCSSCTSDLDSRRIVPERIVPEVLKSFSDSDSRRIVPEVLKSFSDSDSRVRYYACEALYNIAKVTRGDFIVFFNDAFNALCKLSADLDPNVQSAAHLLDRLVKVRSEGVRELGRKGVRELGRKGVRELGRKGVSDPNVQSATHPLDCLVKDIVTVSDQFSIGEFIPLLRAHMSVLNPLFLPRRLDHCCPVPHTLRLPLSCPIPFIEEFIPLLRAHMSVLNPFVQQFLVGWITVLDSVPDIDMLGFLPDLLDGLFNMLGDSAHEIRVQADSALREFLHEIRHAPAVEYGRMMEILVQQAPIPFVAHPNPAVPFSSPLPHLQAVEYGRMMEILVQRAGSSDEFTRLTAVTWVGWDGMLSHG
ncbi:unnamed protein product [Closterium sp. NIES-64]|nr:unnamed protein product [Closterium sp. NIES-64]